MKKNLIVLQDGYKECGAASLLSIIHYYKGSISMARLVELTNTNKEGTNFYQLKQAAEKLGFNANGYKTNNYNTLQEIETPFIIQIIDKIYEHFCVVYTMKKNKVVVMDPAIGQREILIEELKNAKKMPSSKYYNRSFVIISNPKTGEILAMSGKQIIEVNGEYRIYDYTPGIMTSPVAVGSAIKAASQIVGYNTGGLKIGEIRNDACIKIASTPLKCSYTMYGNINDIEALKYSSNTYQFLTAINVGKGNYVYDNALSIDKNAFKIYRDTFAEFGLGVKTEIDLPVESLGYKGSSTLSGHLLDFSIGQYDTYTPIQLSQYIGVLANDGVRLKPYLLKEVYESSGDSLSKLLLKNEPTILNKINTLDEYLNRTKMGLKAVFEYGGTGIGNIDLSYSPAGKTGTSQSFIDTDGDGKVDLETTTSTMVAYAPYDNPIVTFTVISPDVDYVGSDSYYIPQINAQISYKVSKKFFELCK